MTRYLVSLGPTLANHLWQSTAFAVLGWLLTLFLRRNQARARHAIWLAASIKFLVPLSLLVAAGNLLPHLGQPVAPVVYCAMDVVEEPFAIATVPPIAPSVHVPTLRELVESALPACLGVLWLAGAGIVLFGWWNRWRILSRSLRHATAAAEGRELAILRRLEAESISRRLGTALPLLLSAERMEPGVFGIFRPVLVWPRQLSARLDDEHIEAIVAHELTHVRRRDNLTALIHMLVEALFWFHPLVWWMERQMVKEREQACDEAVVEMGGSADTYAESLLQTCRFCIESPLPCVAGVTGADLKRRVADIVTGRALLHLSWPKKLLLAAAMACVVAVPVVLGQADGAQRLTTAAPPTTAPDTTSAADDTSLGPAFEVATIRPLSNPNDGRQWYGIRVDSSGRFTASAVSLNSLVWTAYVYAGPPGKGKVSGGPKWASSETFDINAKIDEAYLSGWDKLSDAQRMDRVRPMIRRLLADRFQLKLRVEMQPTPVYALVQAKGGAKMKEVPAPAPVQGDRWAAMQKQMAENPGKPLPGSFMCKGTTCTGEAIQVSNAIGQIGHSAHADRIVIDETGLKGYYDVSLPITSPDDDQAMAEVEEDLGLKFEPRTVPMKTYVIASAEKPTVDGAEVAPPASAVPAR